MSRPGFKRDLSGWKPHLLSQPKSARVELVPFPVVFLMTVFRFGKRARLASVVIALLVAGSIFSATRCFSQPRQQQPEREDSLKKFLRNYFGKPVSDFEEQGKTRYSSAFVDLAGNGTQDVIVYVTGRSWCGSGGCVTLILSPRDSSYEVVARITITRPPIRVLAAESHGWKDISVQVRGGGIANGGEAKLSFDGKTHPSNPSVPPAQLLDRTVAGKVVIPDVGEGTPLYE